MKPFKTEAMFFLPSYLCIIVMSSAVQSRPCDVVQRGQCKKCSSVDNCYDSDVSPDTCNWCCECDPGTYVKENCRGKVPTSTQCERCPNNTYTSSPNHQISCNESKSLDSCDRLINTEFVLGDSSHDNRCACKDGYFAKNPEIDVCKAHLQCPNGFGVARLGNETHDTECEYCGTGLCSNVTSATDRCKPCNGTVSPAASSTTSPATTTTTSHNAIGAGGVFLGMGIMFVVGVIPCIAFLYWLRKKKRKESKINKSIMCSTVGLFNYLTLSFQCLLLLSLVLTSYKIVLVTFTMISLLGP